jgi:hypothetical protein
MTTTLLTLVPKMSNIPESLSQHLSPQPAPYETELSPVAPKLLTRQIKTSIHHLQRDLLQVLFCSLACDLQLAAEVKVAIALLIAFVLELAQKAGREFAKFATTINESVKVSQEDVRKYEANMQTHVFDRLRASVSNTMGELGQLGERLRGLGEDSFAGKYINLTNMLNRLDSERQGRRPWQSGLSICSTYFADCVIKRETYILPR